MKDIEIAKKTLHDDNLSVVAVVDGVVIFKSGGKGIRPLYELVKENVELISNASVADKVVGRGAALLYSLLNIKELYINLVSEEGMKVLDNYKISYIAHGKCDYIMNNSKDDYCPIEKLSLGLEEPETLIKELDKFFNSIKQ